MACVVLSPSLLLLQRSPLLGSYNKSTGTGYRTANGLVYQKKYISPFRAAKTRVVTLSSVTTSPAIALGSPSPLLRSWISSSPLGDRWKHDFGKALRMDQAQSVQLVTAHCFKQGQSVRTRALSALAIKSLNKSPKQC